MYIIIKFILKNIWGKKLRTILILFSVVMSCALFFASSSISTTFAKTYINRMKVYFGTSDILIYPDGKSPSNFLDTYKAEQYSDELEYAVGVFRSSAVYKPNRKTNINISLIGTTYDEIQKLNPFALYRGSTSLGGKDIIISREFAQKYELNFGDIIEFEISGIKHKFQISALAQPNGFFVDDGNNINMLVSRETLSSFYNHKGAGNQIYVKIKNPNNIDIMIGKLSNLYNRYVVRRPISNAEVQQMTSSMSTPFMLMTLVVAFIAIFIIYSSFSVITTERMPVIGTFRSIGASKKITDFVMFLESLIYGILGGGFGLILGYGILYIMASLTKSPWMKNVETKVDFTFGQMVTAFLFSLILCFISSLIPIIKVSKISLKDIVLNTMEKAKTKKNFRLILGIVLLICSVMLPSITPLDISLITDTICMVSTVIAAVLLIPFITQIFVYIFEKFYILIFGNIGVLAAKNLRSNKSILNNISLLTIGISSLLMINIVSQSVSIEVLNFYNKADYNIQMFGNISQNTKSILERIQGVSDVYMFYETNNIQEMDRKSSISVLDGIDTNKYFEYWKFPILGNKQEVFEKFNEGRTILLTDTLAKRFEVKVGDTIRLKMNRGERNYLVAGFFNSKMNNGSYALIPERYLQLDMGQKNPNGALIKTNGNSEQVLNEIKNNLGARISWIMTIKDMEAKNKQSNDQMFVILKGFSFFAMLIGIFGVINNLIIAFMHRKRQLAIFKSVGMDKKQTVYMLVIEAVTGGFIGGVIGVIAGIFMTLDVPYVMEAVNTPIAVYFSGLTFALLLLAGISITLVASIGPVYKLSKFSIIEAIKYE